jgi:hypothetical protein
MHGPKAPQELGTVDELQEFLWFSSLPFGADWFIVNLQKIFCNPFRLGLAGCSFNFCMFNKAQ